MNPLKVLILITKSNWGGAQRYVFDLATKLPKDRFRVEVMAGGQGPLITKLMEAGIPAHGDLPIGRDVNLFQDIKAFFRLVSLIRQKRPDVLHVNSSKIAGLGSLAGRLAGVKRIIFTAHGWAFNEDRSFFQHTLIILSYWITMLMAHEAIAVSEAMRRQVRHLPWVQPKIRVIHNGIDRETGFSRANARLELSRMSAELKKAIEGVSEGSLIWVGTIAELHHVKGHKYAIAAVKESIESLKRSGSKKKIVYTIVGEGEERTNLEAMIRDAGLSDNIFLLGHAPNAAQYCKAFDIFLLASISEGLGYVLLEAGAAATPVVATAVGGIPEAIDDMSSGILVQPRNVKELAHALLFMIEHPEDRRRYGLALYDKTLKEFSLNDMVSATAFAYLPNAAPQIRS